MTVNALDPSMTVGQLVAERPERARVFEQLGIDYCCGGRKSLGTVCAERGLDLGGVRAQLETSEATALASGDPEWTTAPLTRLVDHIESVHHAFMRTELPRIALLLQKVVRAHGAGHPELYELGETFAGFYSELAAHMSKEDSVLFPWIRRLESDSAHPEGGLEEPIRRMMTEHDGAGSALARMRDLTHGFIPPENACGTYRVMLWGLREIERDMHTHVHKENNILFPRALALQSCPGPRACERRCEI